MANDDVLRELADALRAPRAVTYESTLENLQIPQVLPGQPGGELEAPTQKAALAAEEPRVQINLLVDSLEQTRGVQQEQIRSLAQNTNAIVQSPLQIRNSGGSSIGANVTELAETVRNRFLLSPLLGGVLSLFGSNKPEAPPPLPKYSLPAPIRIDAGLTTGSTATSPNVDYTQDGMPRAIRSAAPAQQITVQVQAFDSRSFIEHSEEIARAVRHAVLNSHALNDVVNEL